MTCQAVFVSYFFRICLLLGFVLAVCNRSVVHYHHFLSGTVKFSILYIYIINDPYILPFNSVSSINLNFRICHLDFPFPQNPPFI